MARVNGMWVYQSFGDPPAERGERATGLRVPADSVEAHGLAAAPPPAPEKSLEEIEEMHLRDSFWTV